MLVSVCLSNVRKNRNARIGIFLIQLLAQGHTKTEKKIHYWKHQMSGFFATQVKPSGLSVKSMAATLNPETFFKSF